MTEINNQVVQMTFNNREFEKNATQTISTIDKLKETLKFSGVAAALSGLSKSLLDVPLKTLGNAANAVTNKFSTTGVVVDQFLRNAETRIESFALRAADSLNIFKNSIQTGFSEYETQIDAVQTIWANTKDDGKTLADITKILDELNDYADKTVYNFSQMTHNIGTFTAAGVGLEESSKAIQGIANLAAMSGTSSAKASNAMYQLSQALAAGRMTLMDWNSVVNAGMGGKVFQKVLIETAHEMGVISDTFAAGLKDGSKTFRDTLTKDGWITSEVLTNALTKFTDVSTELGRTATDAATKVKTFTQLMETLRELIGSGWSQSWEYIIGDFESAKTLFTDISESITALVKPSIDARNKMLEYWSGANIANAEAERVLKEQELHQKEINALANRVLAGEFGNGPERYSALEKLGVDYREVQNAVEALLGLPPVFEEINDAETKEENASKKTLSGREKAIQGIKNVAEILGDVLRNVKLAFTDVFPPLTGFKLEVLSDKFLKFTETLEINRDELRQIRFFFQGVFSAIKAGFNIVSGVINGFTKALSVFAPSSGSFLSAISSIGQSIKEFSDGITKEDVSNTVASFVENLASFLNLEKLKGFFTNVIPSITDGITNFFSGIGAIFKSLANFDVPEAIANTVNLVSNTLKKIFGALLGLDTTIHEGAIFNQEGPTVIEKFIERIKSIFGIGKKIVGDGVPTAIKDATNETSLLGKAMNAFIGKIKQIFSEINLDRIIQLIKTIPKIINAVNFGRIASGINTTSKGLGKFLETFRSFTFIIDPFGGIGKSLSGSISMIGNSFVIVANSIKTTLKSMEMTIKAKALKEIALAVLMLTGAIVVMGFLKYDQLTSGLISIGIMIGYLYALISGLENINIDINVVASILAITGAMFAMTIALAALSLIPWKKLVVSAVSLIAVMFSMAGIAKIFSKVGKDIISFSFGILILSAALNTLILPMLAFSLMNPVRVATGIAVVFSTLLVFAGLAMVLKKATDNMIVLSTAIMLFGVSLSLMLPSLIAFSLIPTENISNAVVSIIKILSVFGAFVLLSSLVKKGDILNASFAIIGFATALGVMIPSIVALSLIPFNSLMGSIIGISAMLLALSIITQIIDKVKITSIIGLSIGIIALSAALALMIPAILSLSTISDKGITNAAKVIFTVVGAFAALGAVMAVINYFAAGTLPLILAGIAGIAVGVALIVFSIGSVIKSIAELITSLISLGTSDMSGFGKNFKIVCDTIIENSDKLKKAFISIGAALIGAFMALLPMLEEMTIAALWSMAKMIGETLLPIGSYLLPIIWEFFTKLIVDGLHYIGDNAGRVIEAFAYCIDGIAAGIENEGGKLQDSFLHLFDAVTSFIVEWQVKLQEKAWEIITSMSDKLEEGKTAIKEKTKEIMDKVIEAIKEAIDDVKQAGKDFVSGIANGIRENEWDPISAATGLGGKLLNSLKNSLDEHSPSKATELMGIFFDEGLGIGIDKGSGDVIDKVKTFGSNMLKTFSDSADASGINDILSSIGDSVDMAGLSDEIDKKMNLETAITPVMDMSNVYSSVSDINSMFGSQSLGLSDLNSSLNTNLSIDKIQNGSYDGSNVVASIAKLDARMDALASAISSIQIRMDTGALVGSIAGPMDTALGQRAIYAGRGIR